MTHPLIDTHCHLDVAEFDEDREAVLARARAVGVGHIIIPAIARAGWEKLAALCVSDAQLHAAYGLHPVFLNQHDLERHDLDQPDLSLHADNDLIALEQRLRQGDAIAVGECGLDHFVPSLDRSRQRLLFEAQLELARQFDLPVIVHARRAVESVIACIRHVGKLRGVIHSYGGSIEQAKQLHDLGFMIGLGGPVTWPGSTKLHRLARELPLEQLLLETDAPDQADAQWKGQRNEPARLALIAETLARLRGMPSTELGRISSANAHRLFGNQIS